MKVINYLRGGGLEKLEREEVGESMAAHHETARIPLAPHPPGVHKGHDSIGVKGGSPVEAGVHQVPGTAPGRGQEFLVLHSRSRQHTRINLQQSDWSWLCFLLLTNPVLRTM